jgi:hypothetical protein
LKIIEVQLFKFSKRHILLDDIDMSSLDKERVKDSFFLTLGFISWSFFIYFLGEIFMDAQKHIFLLAFQGALSIFLFLLWIFAPIEIYIGAHDDMMIKLYEKRPSKKSK